METLLDLWAQLQELWARSQAILAAMSSETCKRKSLGAEPQALLEMESRHQAYRAQSARLQARLARSQEQLGALQQASVAMSPETFKEKCSEAALALSQEMASELKALQELLAQSPVPLEA